MIKNRKLVEKLERDLIKKGKIDPKKNMKIIEAMLEEAIYTGALPLKDPLEGIEIDIKIAEVINSVKENTHKGGGKT